jgi:stage III sporulation protein AA
MNYGSIFNYLPDRLASQINKIPAEGVTEITLNVGCPLIIRTLNSEVIPNADIKLAREDLSECMRKLSRNSVYAFQEEITLGYITLPGGHRAGICGRGIYEKDRIINITDISAISIRVSREIKGCSDSIIPYLVTDGGDCFNMLIISPPGMGKTTLLRDIIRNLSKRSMRIGIADERGEIAACHRGIPQNEIGMRSFVMEGMQKQYAMMYLLRTMSPHVIATDEIGGDEDTDAICRLMNCGVRVIATAHGYGTADESKGGYLTKILDKKLFERIIVLGGGVGRVDYIAEGVNMRRLYGSSI